MAPTNGYSLFVSDRSRQMQKSGKKFNHNALYASLGKEWQSLPESVKQAYKDKANQIKRGEINWKPKSNYSSHSSANQDHKPDIKREPSADVKPDIKPDFNTYKRPREDSDEDERLTKKSKPGVPKYRGKMADQEAYNLRYTDYDLYLVRKECETIIGCKEKKLVESCMFTIGCNVMCKCKDTSGGDDIYIPIEISLMRYSIEKGRESFFHALIDAGPPPVNYVSASIEHCETKHRIAIPPRKKYDPSARSDYKELYKEIVEFVKDGDKTVLIADWRDRKQIKGCITWLYKKATEDGSKASKPSSWTFLPVVEYIGTMHNYVSTHLTKTPQRDYLYYYLKELVTNGLLDFNEAIMCEYHKNLPTDLQNRWCSRVYAVKTLVNMEDILHDIRQMCDYAATLKSRLALPSTETQYNSHFSSENHVMIQAPDQGVPLAIEGPKVSDSLC